MSRDTALKVALMVGAVATGVLLGRTASSGVKNKRPKYEKGSISFPQLMNGTHQLVSPKPGVLVVEAQADIINKVGTGNYKWFLLVRHPKTNEIYTNQVYDHQVFWVKNGATVHPTFREELPFLPSRYKVTVGLKKLQPVREPDGSISDPSGQTLCSNTFYEVVK